MRMVAAHPITTVPHYRGPPSLKLNPRSNILITLCRLPLLPLLLTLLEHLLHNLLLLDQEGTNDAVPDAVGAARATVRPTDGLGRARQLSGFARARGGDALELETAVTAAEQSC